MRAPFIIPESVGLIISRPMSSVADAFSKVFPDLGASLKLMGIKLDDVQYIRLTFLNAILIGIVGAFLFYTISIRFNAIELVQIWGPVISGLMLMTIYLSYLLLFPSWVFQKRAQEIDSNLIFGIRHLLVQTSAGVPFFDALYSASTGYGKVSEEFAKIITEVNGGKDLSEALEASAETNPSHYYRRIMWQIANSTRSGYATADILADLLSYLINDQQNRLKKFGSELNILSIFYLSTCIVLPTFGLIFIIMMSSFSLIVINNTTLAIMIFFIAIFNMMFLGMIRSRRPVGML